jgi:hypothetical protein
MSSLVLKTVVDVKGLLPDSFVVRCAEGESPDAAIARSIERRTSLSVCGGPRADGQGWAMTLGRPVAGGGYSPVAEVAVRVVA